MIKSLEEHHWTHQLSYGTIPIAYTFNNCFLGRTAVGLQHVENLGYEILGGAMGLKSGGLLEF